MLALLVTALVVLVAWKFIGPGERFLPGFVRLLSGPRIERGLFSVLSGRSYASGRFEGRDVVVRLQLKRSRHGQGYLVVAARVPAALTLTYDEIDRRVRDDAGRRALRDLAMDDLLLSAEDGWLKALWRPQGFVIFPGQFVAEKWLRVLGGLHDLASSIERETTSVSAESVEDS